LTPLLLVFFAALFGVLGIYSILADLFLRDRSRVAERMNEEFHQHHRELVRKSLAFKSSPELLLEAQGSEQAAPVVRPRVEAVVDQSGLNLSPGRLLGIIAAASVALGALAFLIQGGVVVGLLVGLAGGLVPLLYVHYQRRARIEKLLYQLPDAFDLMARVLRAGQTIAQALQSVADEFGPPISSEFSCCFEQQNLGLAPETALRDLAQRSGLVEIRIMVLGLLIQQQTGGNLAHLLENLAVVVRNRLRIRTRVKALTGEGRLQAAVLLAMPPLLLMVMLLVHRDYAMELFRRPQLLGGMLVSMGLGALWIRWIIHIEY